MDLGLKGRRALVTGGTRGIGRAIVEQLADEGCDVALCARSAGPVAETVAALEKKGVKAHGGAVDVADLAALKRWVGEAAAPRLLVHPHRQRADIGDEDINP